MAEKKPNDSDGVSQDDIDAALAAAGTGKVAPSTSDDQAADAMIAEGPGSPPVAPGQATVAASTGRVDEHIKQDSQVRPLEVATVPAGAATHDEQSADRGADVGSSSATVAALPLDLPDFSGNVLSEDEVRGISLLGDVQLDVKIELGRAEMYIEDVLKLGEGSVVELDKLAGDPVDVLVNDRLVARGEVLVLNDNFCVRISEILPGASEAAASAG